MQGDNNMEQNKQAKKVTFSEEVDSSISEFALVITFIIVGIFLLFNKDYFGNQIVATIIQCLFITIGLLGFGTEISKLNKNRGIKGIDDLIIGIIIVAIWAVIYYWVKNWIGNLIGFFFLIIGLYGGCRGILEILYSLTKINREHKETQKSRIEIIKEIILILSEIAGIALIVIQILQAIKII